MVYERTFSAAEAAEITGVSTALQRKWRHLGILGAKDDKGWTRWGSRDLARLTVLARLAAMVGPHAAVKMMRRGGEADGVDKLVWFYAMAAPRTKEQAERLAFFGNYAVSINRQPFRLHTSVEQALAGESEPAIVINVEEMGAALSSRAGGLMAFEEPGHPAHHWQPFKGFSK